MGLGVALACGFFCTTAQMYEDAVARATPEPSRFRVDGTALIYDENLVQGDTEIEWADVEDLREHLKHNDQITAVHLTSGGGFYYPALEMARIISDYELDTHVVDYCESSCTVVMAAGVNRTMERGGKVGFHQYYWGADGIEGYYEDNQESKDWESPFDLAEWLYDDTQQEVYERLTHFLSHGIKAEFAIETIRNRGDDMWYPTRQELRAGNMLTE
ncbi:MAG: hypothetical protein CMM86_17690 [Rhodovulum sp.]|nr:hypothetical protein [Rhodovulum sp.]|tara:strand:+ start:716 stop:1363 length:648 start_codon:yes stop_codon:yes gene_type:complete